MSILKNILIRVVHDAGVETVATVYKATEHGETDPCGHGRYISIKANNSDLTELVDCRYMKNYSLGAGAIEWLRKIHGDTLRSIELLGEVDK